MASSNFNPLKAEICFDTPIGRMCFPILASPTFPILLRQLAHLNWRIGL
jgi:hypothetical protein